MVFLSFMADHASVSEDACEIHASEGLSATVSSNSPKAQAERGDGQFPLSPRRSSPTLIHFISPGRAVESDRKEGATRAKADSTRTLIVAQ